MQNINKQYNGDAVIKEVNEDEELMEELNLKNYKKSKKETGYLNEDVRNYIDYVFQEQAE